MSLRELAVRWVPRHSRAGRIAWRAGRRLFGPKVLVPGTLGDIFLLVPRARITPAGLVAAGLPAGTRIDQSWPVKARDVHRAHGYHLCVIQVEGNADRCLNAYRAAFVESSMILLQTGDITPILWRLRGLGDPLGYHAAHIAREAQDLLDPARSEEERFAAASVSHLVRRAKRVVVPDKEEEAVIRQLGSLTPVDVIPDGPEAVTALTGAISRTLAMVKDPAHAALELWAGALADMGVRPAGTGAAPGLAYLEAMDTFRGTSSNLQGRA